MGVFDDKKFEQLDWMTQITETIDSDLNGLLARLPDRYTIDKAYILKNCSSSYGSSISVSSVVRDLVRPYIAGSMSWEEESFLAKCFEFQLSDDLEVDTATGTVSGEITMIKLKQQFSDEELQPVMGLRGIEFIKNVDSKNPPLERMNEILEVLGKCEAITRNRSIRKKTNAICDRLKEIFVTNEWRIRDMGLANKVGIWIHGYIVNGNLADLTNLCKLKVMTHSNMPIYSVLEEK